MSQSRTEMAPGETRMTQNGRKDFFYIVLYKCLLPTKLACDDKCVIPWKEYIYCHDNGSVYGNGTCELQGTANPPQPWGDMLFYPLQTASATRFYWRKWVLFDLWWVLYTFWNLNLGVGLVRHRKVMYSHHAQELETEGFSIVNVSYLFEKVTSILCILMYQCVIIYTYISLLSGRNHFNFFSY